LSSPEKNAPLSGSAVSVCGSKGRPALTSMIRAATGFAPQVSAVNEFDPASDAFPMESVATTVAVYVPPGVFTTNDGVWVFPPTRAGGSTGTSVHA